MTDEFDELANWLEMSSERLEMLFQAAEIEAPSSNISHSLAKLSHWLSRKIGPKVHSELERRKELIVLGRRLKALEVRHMNVFGIIPVYPDLIHISGKIHLLEESLRMNVPSDESYAALCRMYVDIFFAPPPPPDHSNIDEWVNKILVALASRNPVKDVDGVEYVNSSKFNMSQFAQ